MPSPGKVTDLLTAWSKGGEVARVRLVLLAHGGLCQPTRRHLLSKREGYTLEPTEQVHEAGALLADQDSIEWQVRTP